MPFTPHAAFFIPTMAGGGAERVFLLLSRWLADHGCRVDLVLTNESGPYISSVPPSVRVVSFGKTHTGAAAVGLWRYLGRERPDILCSALPTAHILSSWLVRLRRILPWTHAPKHVVTLHELASRRRMQARGVRARLAARLQAGAITYADAAVAVSKAVAHDVASESGVACAELDVIYNPIDVDAILHRSPPVPHPWMEQDQPVIVSAGRFVEQKNMGMLVRALVQMQEPARLILLGEGPQHDALAQLASSLKVRDRVDLPGFVPNPYDYFFHSNAFALSSQWEAFGNVVVEALAAGASVVCTRAEGGVAEILESDSRTYGRLVPRDDVEALATALDAAIVDPFDADIGRQRARAFSVERAGNHYLRLFSRLMNRPARHDDQVAQPSSSSDSDITTIV